MKTGELFSRSLRAEMHLTAELGRIFSLLCPVREREWLPGWKAEVLHSRSGVAEPGCVFRTQDEDGRARIWTITRHEPLGGIVQFVQFLADLCVIRLDIGLHPEGSGTRAVWSYTVAALEPGHAEFFAAYAEDAFQSRMGRLEGHLQAYLSRGL